MIINWILGTSIGRTVAAVLVGAFAILSAIAVISRRATMNERRRNNEATLKARERAVRTQSEVQREVSTLSDAAARERLSRWVRNQ